jgi:hypothetical protein
MFGVGMYKLLDKKQITYLGFGSEFFDDLPLEGRDERFAFFDTTARRTPIVVVIAG